MSGDHLIAEPIASFTHAIDIAGPPESVWPWLAQMGAGRAGWYSFDRLDNGGRPSADRIVPELQHVAPGDVMPAVPGATDVFVVGRVDPPRDLVLYWGSPDGGFCATWEYLVEESAHRRSRLVARGRLSPLALRVARGQPRPDQKLVERLHGALLSLPVPLLRPAARFGHWVMQARALRGIKKRAERRHQSGAWKTTT